MTNIKEYIIKRANEIHEEVISHRRYFHQNPETHINLENTVAYVKEKLVEMGYEPIDCGQCGVVVNVGGKNPGKTFLIRGDMDALPMTEEAEVEYKSTNSNMHACGHDFHAAMMLGAAKVLKEIENEIPGTVKLMFQPAEETLVGCKSMIENGLLENPKVDAGMMIHVLTGMPYKTGSVIFPNGGMGSAASDWFEIHIQGKGGHGAMPETTVDPINVACHIHTAIQAINSREISAGESAVFTVGKIQAGTTSNIIPDTAQMDGTIRTFSREMREFIPIRMREISEYTAKAFRAKATLKLIPGCPSIMNDEGVLNSVKGSVEKALGSENVDYLERVMAGGRLSGSEDFGYLSEKIPTLMVGLGAGCASEGYGYTVHHPKAIFDEKALINGVITYTYCAMNWLEEYK